VKKLDPVVNPRINNNGQVVWVGWDGTDFEIFLDMYVFGDELAMDFGALGLWDVDTAGIWRPI
jgi:hypothetical protein